MRWRTLLRHIVRRDRYQSGCDVWTHCHAVDITPVRLSGAAERDRGLGYMYMCAHRLLIGVSAIWVSRRQASCAER